jgi:hypothetical protein
MLHRCICGLEFVFIPKEIPLSEPEAFRCEDCGREIRGPRCTRYADYVPPQRAKAAPKGNRSSATDGGLAEGWAGPPPPRETAATPDRAVRDRPGGGYDVRSSTGATKLTH